MPIYVMRCPLCSKAIEVTLRYEDKNFYLKMWNKGFGSDHDNGECEGGQWHWTPTAPNIQVKRQRAEE